LAAAEALAEAIYLLRCPSALGDLAGVRGQCLLVALSEPSRCAIPWPIPEESKQARSWASEMSICASRLSAKGET